MPDEQARLRSLLVREQLARLRKGSIRDVLSPRIVRGYLQNLATNQTNEFLFNPAELEESYKPNYVRRGSVGLSHQRLHYVGNENTKIPLTLVFDQLVFSERRGVGGRPTSTSRNDVEFWRRSLLALVYPRRARLLSNAAPPAALFYWPRMINMRVRVMSLVFRHIQFETGLPKPRIMIAQIELEEEPLERIFSEDMLRKGTIRPQSFVRRRRRR